MGVVIIKYNAGNIQSVLFALERIGARAELTDDISTIQKADKVIFPGVGEAGNAMKYLKEKKLVNVIRNLQQPVLGICLGLQLLCRHSEEGNTDGLDIFPVSVKKFDSGLKVPQVGWNTVSGLKGLLFNGIEENSYFYFVHSYYAEASRFTVAETNYGESFSAGLQKDNFYGVQFHPEKSAEAGELLLKNFLAL